MIKYECKSLDAAGATELLCFKVQITLSDTVAVLVPYKELTLEELQLIRIKEECQRAERQEQRRCKTWQPVRSQKGTSSEASEKKTSRPKSAYRKWMEKVSVAMSCMAML